MLLEAGGKDKSWKFHMPAALMYTLCDPKYNWRYYTVPQKNMEGRQLYWPRGKVWGGSSSHNAMVYIRGHAYDYDRWEAEGGTGWSYADCLPYFKKSQTHELGEDDYRGGDGPLYVSRGAWNNPLLQAFVDAGLQAGYPFTEDCNGYQQEGFGAFDRTIREGKRCSASVAYLHPALSRKNLHTKTKVVVTKIILEGEKAIGIEYKDGRDTKKILARKEVILSGGAINSPHLLLLSGIGNGDELKQLDIPVVQHLPGVGKNLQDHLELYVQHKCLKPLTLHKYQWKYPLTMIKAGIEWFLFSTGPAASAHLDAGAFVRSRADVEHPNVQFHFLPSVVIDHGQKMADCHAFQVHVAPQRPTSVGTLRLKSADPLEPLLIDPNYLATQEDRLEFRECIHLAREIFAQKAFNEFLGPEMLPGESCQSDAELDSLVRLKAETAYHPSCTCKMGQATDPLAVVDPECRVLGLENLRVVDASIMPSIVSGNLNGPTIMLAEKAADIILGRQPLPKSSAPVWKPRT